MRIAKVKEYKVFKQCATLFIMVFDTYFFLGVVAKEERIKTMVEMSIFLPRIKVICIPFQKTIEKKC